jgi:O-methyltransferase
MNIHFIRKAKALFLRWNLHRFFGFTVRPFLFLAHLTRLSQWRKQYAGHAFDDFYGKFDYDKRYRLYEHVLRTEADGIPLLYLEFGVAQGLSITWWLNHQKHPESRFYGFDTFEGLPEDWGGFRAGDMSSGGAFPDVQDDRCTFVKGLFQDTLPGRMEELKRWAGHRKVIHLDADLYSSTLFALTSLAPLMRPGDILIFDEFNVPMHEFRALSDFVSAYYIRYEVIGSMNNYFHVAIKLKHPVK